MFYFILFLFFRENKAVELALMTLFFVGHFKIMHS